MGSSIKYMLKICMALIKNRWDKFCTYPIRWVESSVGRISKDTSPLDTKLPGGYILHRSMWYISDMSLV